MFYHLCHILLFLSCLIYRVRPGRWRLLYNNRYMIYYHTNDVQDNLLRMASYSLSVQYSGFSNIKRHHGRLLRHCTEDGVVP